MKLIPSALAAAALLVGSLGWANAQPGFNDTFLAGTSLDALSIGILGATGSMLGTTLGDDRQASDRNDNPTLAALDATALNGANDLLALDVIGSAINVAAVPEPMTYAMYGLGLAAVGFMRRRRLNRE